MKKIVCLLLIMLMAVGLFCGCGNMQMWDTTYSFEYAYITLPNGEIVEGKVDSWVDYESDAVQVVIDGTTYLTHYCNVVLISTD